MTYIVTTKYHKPCVFKSNKELDQGCCRKHSGRKVKANFIVCPNQSIAKLKCMIHSATLS